MHPWQTFYILYECETWSHAQREERKLKMSENMELREIFGTREKECSF